MKLRLGILALLVLLVSAGGIARAMSSEPGATHRLVPGGATDVGRAGRAVQVLCTRKVA